MLKLPHVARDASAPGRPFDSVTPRVRIHQRNGYAGTKDRDTGPVRKRQRTHLRDRFGAAPDHGTIHSPRHGLLQIRARMIESHHNNALCQQAHSIDLLQLLNDRPG